MQLLTTLSNYYTEANSGPNLDNVSSLILSHNICIKSEIQEQEKLWYVAVWWRIWFQNKCFKDPAWSVTENFIFYFQDVLDSRDTRDKNPATKEQKPTDLSL